MNYISHVQLFQQPGLVQNPWNSTNFKGVLQHIFETVVI